MSTDTCTTEACATHAKSDAAPNDATKLKATIVVLSDPKSGSQEEALGRVFNALAAAYDFKRRGDDVNVQFQGAETRWIGELSKEDHPAHEVKQAYPNCPQYIQRRNYRPATDDNPESESVAGFALTAEQQSWIAEVRSGVLKFRKFPGRWLSRYRSTRVGICCA